MLKFLQIFKKLDWFLFSSMLLLAILGLAAIISTTFQDGLQDFVIKQIIAVILGLVLFFILIILDYRIFQNYAYVLYGIFAISLVLVLFLGTIFQGTKGWFNLGFFQFQPAEFMKIALIIILARYFVYAKKQSTLKHIIISGTIMAIPSFLIMLQPDMGSALVLVVIWFGMLLISGLKRSYVLTIVFIGLALASVVWNFFLYDYQKNRITSFINPENDPLGQGYNMIQAKIAIGSGELSGQGLGHGSQSQLKFLPAQHTDFIFAVISEELGFIGSAFLLILFFVLIFRILRTAMKARDEFGLMVCCGIAIGFTFQILVNIGMNLSIMPIAGVPLPLVSYGGSAMIASLISLGIVQSIFVRYKGLEFK